METLNCHLKKCKKGHTNISIFQQYTEDIEYRIYAAHRIYIHIYIYAYIYIYIYLRKKIRTQVIKTFKKRKRKIVKKEKEIVKDARILFEPEKHYDGSMKLKFSLNMSLIVIYGDFMVIYSIMLFSYINHSIYYYFHHNSLNWKNFETKRKRKNQHDFKPRRNY